LWSQSAARELAKRKRGGLSLEKIFPPEKIGHLSFMAKKKGFLAFREITHLEREEGTIASLSKNKRAMNPS